MCLKNDGDEKLYNLDINMHSIHTFQISMHNPSHYIYLLAPGEEKYLNFQVDASGTTSLYVSIKYSKEGGQFHWDSPWIRQQVLGEVAEHEGILVSNPYGTIERELDIEATVKGLGDSEGLRLTFWTDTPSDKYEELAEIKTKKMTRGEEASYTAKIHPKEEGYFTIDANLYDNGRMIGRDSDTIWVEK